MADPPPFTFFWSQNLPRSSLSSSPVHRKYIVYFTHYCVINCCALYTAVLSIDSTLGWLKVPNGQCTTLRILSSQRLSCPSSFSYHIIENVCNLYTALFLYHPYFLNRHKVYPSIHQRQEYLPCRLRFLSVIVASFRCLHHLSFAPGIETQDKRGFSQHCLHPM